MELEDQVCSLELAKRLKELGANQKSHFYWYWSEQNDGWRVGNFPWWDRQNEFAAFTVAELLPYFDEMEIKRERTVWLDDKKSIRWMMLDFKKLEHRFWQAHTDANAAAGLLIHLLETNPELLEKGEVRK